MINRVIGALDSKRGFVAGFLAASVLMGGAAVAEEVVQRDIRVSYLPLRFVFDGVEKAPPQDQQGFTYNGRTYVPLRFLSEALGKEVDYDASTYSIFVGRRPEAAPAEWIGYKSSGEATFKLEYFRTGALNLVGQEMPNSLLVSALTLDPKAPELAGKTAHMSQEYTLTGQRTLSGTLFVPVHYFGYVDPRTLGQLSVLNELNEVIYQSDPLTTRSLNVPFEVDVHEWKKIRVFITVYPYQGISTGQNLLSTQIGLSNFALR